MGCIAFSPLAQGLLSNKYLNGVPEGSRGAAAGTPLSKDQITPEVVAKLQALNEIAANRGQSLAQMAISWVLRDPRLTSALFGASRPTQIEECVAAANNINFSEEDLVEIDRHAT